MSQIDVRGGVERIKWLFNTAALVITVVWLIVIAYLAWCEFANPKATTLDGEMFGNLYVRAEMIHIALIKKDDVALRADTIYYQLNDAPSYFPAVPDNERLAGLAKITEAIKRSDSDDSNGEARDNFLREQLDSLKPFADDVFDKLEQARKAEKIPLRDEIDIPLSTIISQSHWLLNGVQAAFQKNLYTNVTDPVPDYYFSADIKAMENGRHGYVNLRFWMLSLVAPIIAMYLTLNLLYWIIRGFVPATMPEQEVTKT